MAVLTELENLFFGEALHGGAEKVEIKPERMISLTMAALDTSVASDELVPVHIYFSETNTHTLCTLSKKHAQFQQPLQLTLNAGETVSFFVKCKKGRVDLTGYYVNDDGFGSEIDDEQAEMERQKYEASHQHFGDLEGDSEDDDDDSDDDEDDDEDDSDDEDEDEGGIELGDMMQMVGGSDDDEDEDDDDEDDEDDDSEADDQELQEAIKRKMLEIQANKGSKKLKKDPIEEAPKLVPNRKIAEVVKKEQPKAAKVEKVKEESKTLKGGIKVVDKTVGQGKAATKGKQVHVYYSGKLQKNNKQFDACVKGKPFKFRLGGGEVIKGWDLGVEGMKVGGKRTLTIPPGMAYGSRSMGPDLPANSTLIFEVELKNVS